MIELYIVIIFLWAYFDQHGKYLNIFDVFLMSTAGIFVLFIVYIIIMLIIDGGKK